MHQYNSYSGLQELYLNGPYRQRIECTPTTGSGEEMRGIQVSKDRAVDAYRAALKVYDSFIEANKDAIDEIELQLDANREWAKATQRELRAEYEAKRDQLEARFDELKKKASESWFFSGRYRKEMQDISSKQSSLLLSDPRGYDSTIYLIPPSLTIKRERKSLENKLGVASVALGALYLSRADVLEIYALETTDWVQTTIIAGVISRREPESR